MPTRLQEQKPVNLSTAISARLRLSATVAGIAVFLSMLAFNTVLNQIEVRNRLTLQSELSALTIDKSLEMGDWDLILHHLNRTIAINELFHVDLVDRNGNVLFNKKPKRALLSALAVCKSNVGPITGISIKFCEAVVSLSDVLEALFFSILALIVFYVAFWFVNSYFKTILTALSQVLVQIASGGNTSATGIVELDALSEKVHVLLTENRDRELAVQGYRMAAQIAHDIRSPLSVISIATSKLSNENVEVLEALRLAQSRIQEMASGLLERFKPSATMATIPGKERKDSLRIVAECVAKVVIEKRVEFPDLKITIETRFQDQERMVPTSGYAFSRILSNLINNAVAASSASNCRIDLILTSDSNTFRCSVKDFGSGIPRDVLEKLGHEPITSRSGGHGLGIMGAADEIKGSGGSLKISSIPGKGTTVEVALPFV
jgi:signal transduction histidine kinase